MASINKLHRLSSIQLGSEGAALENNSSVEIKLDAQSVVKDSSKLILQKEVHQSLYNSDLPSHKNIAEEV